MSITLLVVLIVAGAGLLAAGIVGLVLFILFMAGGSWRRLAERYGTAGAPAGQVFQRQTVKIGSVAYKRCATVGVADEGLYLRVGRKTVLIPWSECTQTGETMLYWQRAPVLALGNPPVGTIVVQNGLFAALRGRMKVSRPAV